MATPRAVENIAAIPSTLDQLELTPGLAVQIEHGRSRQRVRLELIGAQGRDKLILSQPSSRAFAQPGDRLRARLMVGNWICAFDTQLIGAISEPLNVWVVEYPGQIKAARVRAQTRVPIQMRVRVDGEDPLEGPEGVSGLITDIHLRGASLESPVSLGQVGDRLFVTTLLSVAATEQLVLLPAKIVNMSRQTESLANGFQYGLAFDTLDDETRVHLLGFLSQQMLQVLGYQLDWES